MNPSNLPPGCSDSDIPGNTSEDKAVEYSIENQNCVACKWYDVEILDDPCNDCHTEESGLWSRFEATDVDTIADRLSSDEESRKDEHV